MLKKLLVLALLAVAACRVSSASPDQWLEVTSSHFTVLTNAGEKEGRHLVDQFERMRWVFQKLFPKVNTDPNTPILVYACKNSKTFQSVEPQAYLAKGALKLAGYFLPTSDKNYILIRLDAEQQHPYATVYHEYTHLQFRSAGEWMPIWLNEGMAEFFQNTDVQNKEVFLGQPSSDDILYLRQQRIIPLPVLFKVDANSPYYHEENKGSVFYSESWALTHFLLVSDREKGTSHVSDYMTLMSHHEDPVVAAQKAFGDLKQLQSALDTYINNGQYKQFVMQTAAAAIDDSAYTVRTVPQSESDSRRAELLALVRREPEARDILSSILKTDPNNALAMETMGAIELHTGNHDAARKWYGDAVRLNPKSCLANYYFAFTGLHFGTGEPDPAIESSFRAAIDANPKFAPAYDGLAVYYSMHHLNLEEAYTLAVKAIKLEPGNLYFRMNTANLVNVLGRYDEAVSILEAATKLARNPGELSMVRGRIAQLKQVQQFQAQAQQEQAKAEEERRHFDSLQQDQGDNKGVVELVHEDDKPKHPAEAHGPRHNLFGVIRDVSCSYPTLLEMRLEGTGGKTVKLYSNDFTRLNLTVVGFTPQGPINPCTDFDGLKARVQYAEVSDSSVDGQVTAIELHK